MCCRYDARLHEVKQRTVLAQEELRQLQARPAGIQGARTLSRILDGTGGDPRKIAWQYGRIGSMSTLSAHDIVPSASVSVLCACAGL